ncbi:hypothetical protein [Calidithermus roseus]|uniref:Uncharacterized protein n=1 Tax=Calidithermus roseus TaxID=1644118 RepID=A0A399EW50_9DEIN|nr:hypothetical protein [Calidithermus roseus]RIH87666.1 hypothetical protein Mrose_01223 [Calidithermus roseus]
MGYLPSHRVPPFIHKALNINEDPTPPNNGAEEQSALKKLRQRLTPLILEDARAVGAVLASVFRYCRGEYLRRAVAKLYDLQTFWAFAEYEEQPGRPLGFDYRVPVVAEEDLPALEAACRRHNLPFPPGAGQVHPLYLKARDHSWVLEEDFQGVVLEEMARRMDEEQAAIVRAEVAAQKALRKMFQNNPANPAPNNPETDPDGQA